MRYKLWGGAYKKCHNKELLFFMVLRVGGWGISTGPIDRIFFDGS